MAEEKAGGVSRREFIVGAGAATGGLVVGGLVGSQLFPRETKPWLPERWDKEADVVVCGYGGAGVITAITAHDFGAKVLVLEKAPEKEAGGNTLVTGGGIFHTRDPDKASQYLQKLNWGATPDEVTRVFLQGVAKQEEFYAKFGFPMDPTTIRTNPEWPEVKGGDAILLGRTGSGERFFEVFRGEVNKRGIEVLFETPAKKLIQDGATKEIRGVIAEHNGTKMHIKAKRAVVLCTGGFQFNKEMMLNYIYAPLLAQGSPYNAGDGILMAQDVGADLWHMAYFVGCNIGFELPGYNHSIGISMPAGPWIWVDKYGKRFTNEKRSRVERHGFAWRDPLLYFDPPKVDYPRIPAWVIADETTRLKGAWGRGGWAELRGYKWSADNNVEISKGWVLKADTVSDLAVKMDVDPKVLVDTITKYNEYCKAGKDLDFGSDPKLMFPIEKPPFYALQVKPQILNTQGGPRRNAKAQILETSGKPIPRLYGGGECGSIVGWIYQSCEGMAENVVFGQIAGENAAKEKPWE